MDSEHLETEMMRSRWCPWTAFGPSMIDAAAVERETQEANDALNAKLDELFDPEKVRQSQALFYESALKEWMNKYGDIRRAYELLRHLFTQTVPGDDMQAFAEWEKLDEELGI